MKTTRRKSLPRNQFEKKLNSQLRRAKISFKYEAEKIPYILARHYLPDFIVTTPLGKIYIEAKGYLRPEDKAKLIAVKKCNPNIDLRIVFYADKKQYTKWADKNGIRWSIGIIPKQWLKGL